MLVNNQYQFTLKFFTYDKVSDTYAYPITRSFTTVYSPTIQLVISFPYQVLLSQERPPEEIRIDHLDSSQLDYDFPEGTYAYTTQTPLVVHYDTSVYIKSFWLRLHRNPQVYMDRSYGTRTV